MKSKSIGLKPSGKRIIAEPVEQKEKTEGGLYIPEQSQEKPMECIVRAVGGGVEEKSLKIGMKILCSKYGGTEIKLDGRTFRILNEDDILGIVE